MILLRVCGRYLRGSLLWQHEAVRVPYEVSVAEGVAQEGEDEDNDRKLKFHKHEGRVFVFLQIFCYCFLTIAGLCKDMQQQFDFTNRF